ncbi:MAG: hypothetical protein COB54_08610 [Alphaproteobacteria bacterium]|nr:MAG: hypothetical protein COB54_08610 [Alphaproteobacteria bacterium]
MFIDYGSGKGRALLHASSWPFKEVIGVEISESLHKIACKNIGIYSNPEQACEKISSHCADVTEFEPPLLPLVCYFYNPFGAEIMQKVIQRLENSYNLKKRPIWVIYISPVHKNHILERPHWYMVNEGENYCIFMLKPEVFDAET